MTEPMGFLWQKGVLMELIVHRWSMRAKLDKKDVDIPDDVRIPDIVNLGNKRLMPKSVEAKFINHEMGARNYLRNNSFVFPIGRNNFVPFKSLVKTLGKLSECQTAWNTVKNTFFDDETDGYEYHKQAMLKKYPILTPQMYPDKNYLRDQCNFTIAMFNLNLPESFAKSEAAEKIHQQMDVFLTDVVGLLRQKTIDICQKIQERIETGKFDMRHVQSLTQWINKFKGLNFMEDTEVEEALNALREELPKNRDDLEVLDLTGFQKSINKVIHMAETEPTKVRKMLI